MQESQSELSNEEDIGEPFQHDIINARRTEIAVRPSTVACDRRDANPFRWAKPAVMDRYNLTATAKLEAALAMEEAVRQKDRVIRSLARQLRKANEEKYGLIMELAGYRGPEREKLYEENCILRERFDRVTRENLMLRGLQRREKNTKLSKKLRR